jgi:hypothetical protein
MTSMGALFNMDLPSFNLSKRKNLMMIKTVALPEVAINGCKQQKRRAIRVTC